MPWLASLSMRGVGIVPPYTPKFPQPTLSTRMKTMLGFSLAAWVGATAPKSTAANGNKRVLTSLSFTDESLIDFLVNRNLDRFTCGILFPRGNIRVQPAGRDGRLLFERGH